MDTMKDTTMQPATDAVIEELRKMQPAAWCYEDMLGRKCVGFERPLHRRNTHEPLFSAATHAVVMGLVNQLEAAEKERDFAKTEIARLHDDIRELTDERVLDEEDRDLIVAWRQGTSTKPTPSVPDGWKEAAIAWEVCASIHREYGKGKDPFFNTRQGDFVKHANDARAMLAAALEAKP